MIFGTGNPLLWYGADIRVRKTGFCGTRRVHSGAPGACSSPSRAFGSTEKLLPLRNFELHKKIGLLHEQKADSGVWRQELLCGPDDSGFSHLQAAKGLLE